MKKLILIAILAIISASVEAQVSPVFRKVTVDTIQARNDSSIVFADSIKFSNGDALFGGVGSGKYLPTDSLATNIDAVTIDTAFYYQVGNVVTVSGTLTIDPTAGAAPTFFYMSLPINMRVVGDTYFVGGVFHAYSVDEGGAVVFGTQQRALFQYFDTGTAANVFSYTFSYRLE